MLAEDGFVLTQQQLMFAQNVLMEFHLRFGFGERYKLLAEIGNQHGDRNTGCKDSAGQSKLYLFN